MAQFESTSTALDALVAKTEAELGVQPSNVDADDFWAGRDFQKSSNVYKVRCNVTEGCTYKMTKPFEQYCPLCEFKDGQQKIPIELDVSQLIFAKKDGGSSSSKSSSNGGDGEGKGQGKKGGEGKKDKGEKKSKKGGGGGGGGGEFEPVEFFDKAKIQVGFVKEVKEHPESEFLYVCQVDVGNDETRQVCAGLRKFVAVEELLETSVVVITNLKALKLRGVDSQAMIMASEKAVDENNKEVAVLRPAAGSAIGERVFLEGKSASESPNKTLSKKHWEKVLPLLTVQNGHANYNKQFDLVTSAGPVSVAAENDTIIK